MLKFFRRIRQKLLAENQFSKYLLYAIGEIILVMIGILLALQVNNWNEERKLKNEQRQYLMALKEEFQNNLLEVRRTDTVAEFIYKANKNLLNFSDENGIPLTTESYMIINRKATQFPPKFNPSPGILNDLINAGQLSKLKNGALRLELNRWMVLLEDVRNEEKELWQHREKILNHFLENQSMRKALLNEGFDHIFFDGLNDKFLENEFTTGLDDPYYDNVRLLFGIVLWSLKEDYYPKLEENINTILRLIETELENY